MRAACVVGGGEGDESYDLFLVALEISYIMTTNFSRILWSSLPSTGGYWLSFRKTVDASGHAFHVCHAVFSPFPWYADTTSQPLNAWIIRRHIDLSTPIEGHLSFMRIRCFVLDQMKPTVFLHQGPAELTEHWSKWQEHLCCWLYSL